jgi:hypothetical protein
MTVYRVDRALNCLSPFLGGRIVTFVVADAEPFTNLIRNSKRPRLMRCRLLSCSYIDQRANQFFLWRESGVEQLSFENHCN